MLLPEPYELIDLHDGQSIVLQVTGYEDGSMIIHPNNPTPRHIAQHMSHHGLAAPPPAGTPISLQIPVLRLFGRRLDQPSSAPYWDVSAKTLQADLATRLDSAAGQIPGSTIILRSEGRPRGKTELLTPRSFRLTANGTRPHKRYSVEEA